MTTETAGLEALYTPIEASRYLRCDRETVYTHLRTEKLRGVKVGRHWRIPESALAEFISGHAA